MTKTTIIAALTLAALMSETSAQSGDASTTDSSVKTTSVQSEPIYDASGKLIGSMTTDRSGWPPVLAVPPNCCAGAGLRLLMTLLMTLLLWM